MKKLLLASCLFTSFSSVYAQTGDLVLPGEKWLAKFNGYICAAFGPTVEAPRALAELNVKFERMTSDSSLDNGLIKATFEDDGVACRYNAIILADNAAATSKLVRSIAYSPAGKQGCARGKAVLDKAFQKNDYLYYGHPHHLAFMAPVTGAEGSCAKRDKLIGIDFVVTGLVRNQRQ